MDRVIRDLTATFLYNTTESPNMTRFTLRIEDRADTELRDVQELQAAIARLTLPHGPTYVVVSQSSYEYAQAAGSDGRYIVESREFLGEGFVHWAAGFHHCDYRSETVVHYRTQCPRDEHPPRQCPLNTVVKRVLGHSDVLAILLHYYATGSRLAAYAWDDVTADYAGKQPRGDDDPIQQIVPGS